MGSEGVCGKGSGNVGSEGVWEGEVVMWEVRVSGKGGGNVGSEGCDTN